MSTGSATTLDGDVLAARLRGELAAEVIRLRLDGVVPTLATVTVGRDPFTSAYMSRKHQDCLETGVISRDLRFPSDTSEAELLQVIDNLNGDREVTGFSVQFPLPPQFDERRVIERCDPRKDADGKHPLNLGLLQWEIAGPLPCTAAAVLALLRAHDVELRGRRALIIGRGFFVGRPLTGMLSAPGVDATVTVAHRATRDLQELSLASDVIISSAGVPDLVTASMVRKGAAVVGVGITYIEGKMVSDIADDVATVAAQVTPRHGSVGALTRAMLLKNLLGLAERGS